MNVGSDVLVTVYCVTYNHRKYIRRCLDSLVSQNADFRYEIFVHDDASTDGTTDIVREYAEKYPGLVIPFLETENQFSKGVSFVRSRMLPATTGKYIVEIEGDDYWCDPDKLRLQVEALEAHPECSACVHATDTVDVNGEPTPVHFPDVAIDHPVIGTDEFMRCVLNEKHWLFHLSSIMIPADDYREYKTMAAEGFPRRFYIVGDLPMFLYFSMKGGIYFIDRVMSVYTIESGGFMSRVKSDPTFAMRVHQGYIDGLEAFDAYSGYRYHEGVTAALLERRFEVDRISHRFDRIVKAPEYRPLIRKRGAVKTAEYYAMGGLMLLFGKKKKEGDDHG